MQKKRIESIYSALDIGFNSLIAFLTFLYINRFYGIDLLGYFGLLLSVTSFIETVQMGFYEKPAYLGFGIGFKDFKLKVHHLFALSIFPLLAINQLIIPGYFLAGVMYSISYVLIQNIRIHDYINHDIKKVTIRSFLIFLFTISFYLIIFFGSLKISLSMLIVFISLFRFLFVIIEKEKIFSIKNENRKNEEIGFLVTSLLTLVRSRLPLWSLLPFGLGLVGIYEVFRTLLEIYLVPSRPIFLVMIKNLKREGPRKIFRFGIVFALLTLILVSISFFTITSSTFFGFNEISNSSAFLSLLFIVLFFWLSEISGMIFQFNGFITFEALRRASSIIIFIFTVLLLFRFLDFRSYLFMISFMYFVEFFVAFYNKDKLRI
jgi:hypothetical protein